MNHMPSIEQRLTATGRGRNVNTRFVRRTMQTIKEQSAANTFDQVLSAAQPPQRSWRSRLMHLPKAATVGLLVLLCAVASGTAYAAYTLWIRPTAQVRSTGQQYGRDQALIDLKNCYRSNQKVDIEITSNSGGTAEEAAKNLEAQCEIQALQNWAIQTFHAQPSQIQFAFLFSKLSGDTLIVETHDTHNARNFVAEKGIPIVYRGQIISSNILHTGETVALLTSKDGKAALALVKLSQPAAAYLGSSHILNTYHERTACIGNTSESCIQLPNMDVLRSGEAGANPGAPGDGYEIQGKLISASGTQFTLESTSGRHYTVHTDSDLIGAFNAGNPYDPVTIEPGDVLMVLYHVPGGGNPQDIKATQYQEIQLMLQSFSKGATKEENVQKYHY